MRVSVLLTVLLAGVSPLLADGVTLLSPKLIDHGKMRMGIVLEDTIRFVNSGTERLVIENVSATCGCTTAQNARRIVMPGDTAAIPYFFNTRGFKGVVRKQITVHLKGMASLVYTFQLQVVEEIIVEPRYYYLPGIEADPDTAYVRTVQLGNYSGGDVSILRIQTNSDQLRVYPARAVIPKGKTRTFKIRFIPSTGKDSHYTVLFHTDYAPLGEIKVPFYVTYR